MTTFPQRSCFVFCLLAFSVGLSLIGTPLPSQEPAQRPTAKDSWSREEAERHADRYNNPNEWDAGYRKQDISVLMKQRTQDYFLGMPFPFSGAFPAPRYEYGDSFGRFRYNGLQCGNPVVPEPFVLASTAINQFVDKTKIPAGKDYKDVLKIEPLMYVIASGPEQLKHVEVAALSRSCPNFFFQGSFTNQLGDVDWVAVRTGFGKEIGIINGRILDLTLGNLILVRQFPDGSVRICQTRARLQPNTHSNVNKDVAKAFESRELKEFFNDSFEWVQHSAPEFPETPLGDTRVWTKDQLAYHADNYNNPRFWNKKLLESDAERLKRPLSPEHAATPFPWVAFPIPYYLYNDKNYSGLSVGPERCPENLKATACSLNRPVKKEDIPPGKTWVDVLTTDPLLYIATSGPSPIRNVYQWAISRSHPHYLFQGSFESEHGQIDWVGIRMQDGTEIAIINGRIIDLSFGNLIQVRQEESGFINIFQNRSRLKSGKPKNISTQFQKLINSDHAKAFFAIPDQE